MEKKLEYTDVPVELFEPGKRIYCSKAGNLQLYERGKGLFLHRGNTINVEKSRVADSVRIVIRDRYGIIHESRPNGVVVNKNKTNLFSGELKECRRHESEEMTDYRAEMLLNVERKPRFREADSVSRVRELMLKAMDVIELE